MKKIVTLLCVIGFSLTTYAEMLLWQNGEFTIANLDSITFAEPSVFVMPNTLNLGVGDSENLSAVLVPEQTSYDVPITWTSDNEEGCYCIGWLCNGTFVWHCQHHCFGGGVRTRHLCRIGY